MGKLCGFGPNTWNKYEKEGVTNKANRSVIAGLLLPRFLYVLIALNGDEIKISDRKKILAYHRKIMIEIAEKELTSIFK